MVRINRVATEIDNPMVKCSNMKINTVKTDFSYYNIFKRKSNFHIYTDNAIKNINSITVLPDSKLEIVFKYKPKSYAIFKRLDNGNHVAVYYCNNNEIKYMTTPHEPGKYIYSISAEYDQGLAIYYFSITINKT